GLDGLVRAIAEQDTQVVPEHGVAHCRFDANAGRASRDDQVLDPHRLQSLVQVRPVETAEASLVDDGVTMLRLELIEDVGVPGITDEDTAFASVRCRNDLPDAKLKM